MGDSMDKERIIFHVDVNNAFLSWTAVKLLEEENIKLYEIYVKEYIRECSSVNVLIYNIILQFLENKGTLSILDELK